MMTIADLIDHNAFYLGRREAFLFEGRRTSHEEFAARVKRLGSALYKAGLRRGDRIALISPNRAESLEVFGTAEASGYIVAPVNQKLSAAEMVVQLKDSQPMAVLFDSALALIVGSIRAQIDGIAAWVAFDGGETPAWATAYEAFRQSGDDAPPIRAHIDDVAYLFYTSGTTGRPKGAMITHRSQLAASEQTCAETEIRKGGSWLVHSPMFHTGANGPRVAQQLRGGRTVLHGSFDPARTLRDIQDEKINGTFTVATMLQAILDVPGSDGFDLSSVSSWMIAGAPCSAELLRRAIGRLGPIFCVQYGMTEGRVTGLSRLEINPHGDAADLRRLRSVGRPPPSIKLRIVDDAGNDCPLGAPGEIVFKSPSTFVGYWSNQPATIAALRDGWMHSGDMGYLDEDKYLYLVDRKKDMIISGGENIYSREVEGAIEAHPDVAEVAVIGVPDAYWGESVKAVVVARPGAELTEREVIDHARTLIANYKCPRAVTFVAELPHVASGKIDKPALRRSEMAHSATAPA